MKQIILIISVIISNVIYGQTDSSFTVGICNYKSQILIHDKNKPCLLPESSDYGNGVSYIDKKEVIVVTGAYQCGFYKGDLVIVTFIYDSIEYQANAYYFTFRSDTTLNHISQFNDSQKMKFRASAFEHYNTRIKGLKMQASRFIEKTNKIGLYIESYSIFPHSEYSDATDFKIKIHNSSKKKIKYVTIGVVGYNSVDDKIVERGKSLINLKCVGPILPGDFAEFEFEFVWFSKLLESCKITSIKIEYFDGTTKAITKVSDIIADKYIVKYLPE